MMENKLSNQYAWQSVGATSRYRMPLSKRIFDLILAIAVLDILFPFLLILIIAILVESKGRFYYTSKRIGRFPFDLYKFRSTRTGDEAQSAKERELNETRVGRFMRKTGLDELPQLINVIRGDMSIVGNRPLPMYEAEQLTIKGESKRFLAPAGMISLCQVEERHSRHALSVEERISYDNAYADHFAGGSYSIWYDIALIMRRIS